jgi:hypothetical protein
MHRTFDFTMVGFKQEGSIRHFNFERLNDDRTKSDFTVDADTSLTRKYGITLQDLPLLCRRVLEETVSPTPAAVLTFGEDRMQAHANQREANQRRTEELRQARKKPHHENVGDGFRRHPL